MNLNGISPGELVSVPTIGRRLAAMLYESLLMLGVLSVAFMVPHLLLGMGAGITLPGLVVKVHFIAVFGVYFLWYWTHGGQTLAMQTWKLRIVSRATAAPPSLKFALLRFALCWPSLCLGGIGVAWALVDRDGQFLHDRLAGTRIVRVG